MNILFSICGRSGSKGVKNKNIRTFLNQPLYAYTLRAARLYIERYRADDEYYAIVFSTDSKEFLQMLNKEKDCIIRERSKELAQDNSPKMPVILDALEYAQSKTEQIFDYVIDLDITSPIRTVENIRSAVEKKLNDSGSDVVFSVTHARRNPHFNMVRKDDAYYVLATPSDFVARQQAPVYYDMNASIYVYESAFLKSGAISPLAGKADVIIMEDTGIIDIDSENDFSLMEHISLYLKRSSNAYKEIFR